MLKFVHVFGFCWYYISIVVFYYIFYFYFIFILIFHMLLYKQIIMKLAIFFMKLVIILTAFYIC